MADTRERVRRAYSQPRDRYDRKRIHDPRGRILTDHDVPLFLELLPAPMGGEHVLEIGAGTGRFTLPALDAGYRLVATDVNEAMLAELKSNVADRSEAVRLQKEDAFGLSFGSGSSDLVFSIHVVPRFLTLSDQRAAISEMARVLKPGGRLIFNYRNRQSLVYGRFYRGYATSSDEIAAILADHDLEIEEQRSKFLLTRALVDRLPVSFGKAISHLDRGLRFLPPTRAWDVFVRAAKR